MHKTPNNHPEQETHTQEPQGQATTEQEATPPWERDGEEFNPERAWALIQALRAEKEQLKTKAEQAAAAEPAQAPAEPAKEEGTEEPAPEENPPKRARPRARTLRLPSLPPPAPIVSALSGVARSAGVDTHREISGPARNSVVTRWYARHNRRHEYA